MPVYLPLTLSLTVRVSHPHAEEIKNARGTLYLYHEYGVVLNVVFQLYCE